MIIVIILKFHMGEEKDVNRSVSTGFLYCNLRTYAQTNVPAIVILASSLTLRRSNPLSAQLIVICRINSSDMEYEITAKINKREHK